MIARPDSTATLAFDMPGLEQLRAQAKKSPDQALHAAAQQFESVFLNMLLKSMRAATPEEGMLDSEQTKMFTGMLDQQLAQNMASRGVGLADIMVKQLSRTRQAANGEGNPEILRSSATSPLSAVQQNFMNQMLPHAQHASRTSPVPVQLMLGQAALESGWGKREIRMADGSNSHNLFGIKAHAGWQGEVAEVMTTEYENGVAQHRTEKFRAYSSYAEAFQDYTRLIGNSPRYAEVLQQGGDAAGMAQALQKSGYATDPRYAEKLAGVMEKMNLPVHSNT